MDGQSEWTNGKTKQYTVSISAEGINMLHFRLNIKECNKSFNFSPAISSHKY